MIKIAAFIEPKGSLKKEILLYKKLVKKNFGEQEYLSHPPHCTLFTMHVSKKVKKYKKLRENFYISQKLLGKKNLTVYKTGIFKNDPITNGDTIYFKVKKNAFIKKLQILALKRFKFFKYKSNKTNKFKFNWMKKNYTIYGYPFVGNRWTPHFTVASLEKKTNKKKFLKSFLNLKIFFQDSIERISFYEVKYAKHIYLWSVKINKNV